jgi:hypothetical protein
MNFRIIPFLVAVGAGAVFGQASADSAKRPSFEILPQSHRMAYLWTDPTAPNIFLRFLTDSGLNRDDARIGTELPLLGYGPFRLFGSGFAHLVLFPKNSVFSVDRFHAGLACGFGWANKEWTVSVAPLYHESAHLADGHRGDIGTDRRVLSRESVQSEVSWGRKGFLAVLKGDWWWHSIRTRYRWDCGTGVQYEAAIFGSQKTVYGPAFSAFAYFLNTEQDISFNYEINVGVFARNGNRLLRLSWTAEDRDGLGQDQGRRSRGTGLEIGFSLMP